MVEGKSLTHGTVPLDWLESPKILIDTTQPTKNSKRKRQFQARRWEPTDRDRAAALRKVADPDKYPDMTAREVGAFLGLSHKTVYELPRLEKSGSGTKRRLWTTRSVIALKNSPPE